MQAWNLFWLGLVWLGAEPGTVTITKPTAPPVGGSRHYLVQVQIVEVDELGKQTIIAKPILQTQGAAAGVTIDAESGRRFEFHFTVAEPGAPTPLPVLISQDEVTAKLPSTKPDATPTLEQKVTIKAVRQPRKDVLRNVARQAGLSVAVEPETAAAAAEQLAAPITFEVDNAPLEETLRQLVAPLEAEFSVRHDLVLIGLNRPHDDGQPGGKPVTPATPTPTPARWQIQVYPVADLVGNTPDGKPDFERLIARLEREVAPKSWAKAGGEGSIRVFQSTESLVIRQDAAGHAAIAKLLEACRQEATKGN